MTRIADRVFAERDEACEGGDERPDAADIHAHEELAPVFGEVREQDRRGDVADELAGEGREEHDVLVEKRAEGVSHDVEPRRIPRKDEEEHEGEEERIVDRGDGVPVEDEQRYGDDEKPGGVGDRPEDHQHGHEEEDGIENAAGFIEPDRLVGYRERLRLHEDQAGRRDEQHGEAERGKHRPGERARRDVEAGVEVEVLRIAERREHAAEICGNRLHYEAERDGLLPPAVLQDVVAQRQEREQRHVVCDEHGAEEGDPHEREDAGAGVPEEAHDVLRKDVEEPDVLQRGDDGEGAEEAGEGLVVDISGIARVRRNEENRHDSQKGGDAHDGVLFEEGYGVFRRFRGVTLLRDRDCFLHDLPRPDDMGSLPSAYHSTTAGVCQERAVQF